MVGVHSNAHIYLSPLLFQAIPDSPLSPPSLPFPHLLISPTNLASTMNNPSLEIRNSPLKLNDNKVSNLIKKPLTSTSTSSSSASVSSASHRPPVIIYTHSPKIIHTRACDFMALVQKLTGFSRSSNDDSNGNNDDDTAPLNKKRKISVEKKKEELSEPSLDELSPQQRPSVSPATNNFEFCTSPSDVPLFVQAGFTSEFFDLPNEIYKYSEMPGSSALPNINGATPTFSEI